MESSAGGLVKPGASAVKQSKIDYAFEISGGDKNFVYLLEAENAQWTHDRRHLMPYHLCWNWSGWNAKRAPDQRLHQHRCRSGEPGWFWRKHWDWGLCGIGDGYKKHITDDPRMFTDWKWQMHQCLDLYRTGTRFYGADNIWKTKQRFTTK